MKKTLLLFGIVLSFLVYTDGIQAQTTGSQLNQLVQMKQFIGTWQMDTGEDSVLVAEIQQQGKAFVETDYRIIKGEKSWLSIWSYSFSSKEGKFKLFDLNKSGNYTTWIASFTSEKKWIQEQVQNFSPEKVLRKVEIVFESPSEMTATFFNSDGVKTGEEKAIKVK